MRFIKITQVKSTIGRLRNHKACVRGLGLRRIGHTVLVKDTPANWGMIKKVQYLLRVEGNIRIIKKTSLGLWISTSKGIGKKKIGLDHLWAAPIRKTFSKGTPNGTWLYATIEDPQGVPRVLGSFVRTIGNRTLFCPGIDIEIAPIGAQNETEERVTIDHVTLDPRSLQNGTFSWNAHVATIDSARNDPRGIGWSADEKSDWMVPWFSLIVPSFDSLDVLPQEIFIPHEAPTSDLPERPKRTLGDYKRPVTLKCAQFPPAGEAYFLQIDFWISEDRAAAGLKSHAFNFVTEKPKNPDVSNTWKGQTDFDLLSNKFWIRGLISIRSGTADFPCVLAIRGDEALLL